MGNVNEKVLDAMDILIDQSVNKASYNRTIQAQIISCEDATIGKYKCRYQDAIIYAYSENPDVTYNEKTFVYIDIPGNDMSKDKFIRGTSKRLGINYISQAEGDQAYDIIGTNCLITNTTFYLKSECKDYKYTIYKYKKSTEEQSQTKSEIQFNITALEQYIKQSSSLIVGATFKTSLDPKQQYRGHYGITYNLCFFDNALNREAIRSYTVDEDNMVDNPYRLIYPTRQYEIFDIDGPNFDHIESIEIFCKDFPNATEEITEILLSQGDIEITNLELTGAVRMADSEINGIAISFYTPQGTFFTDSDEESTEKVITAQVRVKGKLASSAQNIPFYWGIQNVGITPDSEYYNKYLGRGWRCLNDKNVIQTAMIPIEMTDIFSIYENEGLDYYYFKDISNKVYVGEKDSENYIYTLLNSDDYKNLTELQLFYQRNNIVEWVPSKDTYIFNKNNAITRNNKLKVAIVYDGTVVTKTITIQNLGKTIPILTIESSEGTQFYYDIGHPTLTCKVDGEQKTDYRYQWAYEDSSGFGKISSEAELYKKDLEKYKEALDTVISLWTNPEDKLKYEEEYEESLRKLKEFQIEEDKNTLINKLNNEIKLIDVQSQIQLKYEEDKTDYLDNLNTLYNEYLELQNSSYSNEVLDNFKKLINSYGNREKDQNQTNYKETLSNAISTWIDIINGKKYLNAQKETIQALEEEIKSFNFIQRVSGNKVYDVQICNITSFKTFKCSVYNEDGLYLGTAAITLTNKLEGQDLYSLVINNGSVTFQYNEDGIAPTSKSLQNPQQIQALSFTVYDNLGNPIDSKVIQNTKNCEITWRIPLENTMLVDQNEDGSDKMIIPKKYVEYNRLNLLYGIANGYDIQKQNNQIELKVKYNEMNLTAKTNFTFIKQGEPGTNGTQYIVKIVPNTKMTNPPLWPMITKTERKNTQGIYETCYILNYEIEGNREEDIINPFTSYQFFKAQLWRNGEKLWEGAKLSPNDPIKNLSKINWEILTNPSYKKSVFKIDETTPEKINFNSDIIQKENDSDSFCNIVKCTITWRDEDSENSEVKSYYGTIPIITAQAARDYNVYLKDYTGFKYVIYTSDGVLPKYDNSHPFEFICEQKIDDSWEDISLLEKVIETNEETEITEETDNYIIKYIVKSSDDTVLEILKSDFQKEGLLVNQWQARPASRDDGSHINIAIYCTYMRDDQVIGKIRIPIHFLLNKYGMAHINEWDGNSVQINKKGGYILSPQMGAGTKKDNTFTGVLMGEVRTKTTNKTISDIGLLGYASGDRTFFLNSENGSAIFGKANSSQIIIDPFQKRGMIYSGNFWNSYDNNTGLPSSYTYRDDNYKPSGNGKKDANNNVVGAGLLIDLTTPEIYFGNGNFYVTKDGHLHAAGGGDIAGWQIGTDTLTGGNIKLKSEGSIEGGSSYKWKIETNGKATFNYLTADSGGSIGGWTITTNDDKEKILKGGSLTLNSKGKIYAETSSDINKYPHNSLEGTGNGFYLGGDGLSIGSRFKVSSNGVLTVGDGAVAGTGGNFWTISGNSIDSYISYGTTEFIDASQNKTKENESSVYIGTDGISLGKRFSINRAGTLNAYAGTIGGWTIGNSTLTGGDMTINSEGSIKGKNWHIDKNGNAKFSNTTTLGGTFTFTGIGSFGSGGSLGANGMGWGKGGSPYLYPSKVNSDNGKKLDEIFVTVANFDQTHIKKALSYKGKPAFWDPVVSGISIASFGKRIELYVYYKSALCNRDIGGHDTKTTTLSISTSSTPTTPGPQP